MSTKGLLPIFFFAMVFFGCTEKSTGPDTDISKIISGTYRMSGTQIEYTYDFFSSWLDESDLVDTDTIEVVFDVRIEYLAMREDTIQFLGLPGVNTGNHQVLPSHPNCETNPEDCAYARFVNNIFEMNFLTPTGKYAGSGTLVDENISLNASFEYRNIAIEYRLAGRKIE